MSESFIPRITLAEREDALLLMQIVNKEIQSLCDERRELRNRGKATDDEKWYSTLRLFWALAADFDRSWNADANTNTADIEAEMQGYYDRVMPNVPNKAVESALGNFVDAVAESLDPTINKD